MTFVTTWLIGAIFSILLIAFSMGMGLWSLDEEEDAVFSVLVILLWPVMWPSIFLYNLGKKIKGDFNDNNAS